MTRHGACPLLNDQAWRLLARHGRGQHTSRVVLTQRGYVTEESIRRAWITATVGPGLIVGARPDLAQLTG